MKQTKKTTEKKMGWAVLIVILALIAIIAWMVFNFAIKPRDRGQEEELIGGQRDQHGCLAPAGYSWCEIKKKCLRKWEENCGPESLDEIFSMLSELREKSGISFSYIEGGNLEWIIEKDGKRKEESWPAKEMKADTASDSQRVNLEDLLIQQGFQPDLINKASGPSGGLTGYTQDKTACMVRYQIIGSEKQALGVTCAVIK